MTPKEKARKQFKENVEKRFNNVKKEALYLIETDKFGYSVDKILFESLLKIVSTENNNAIDIALKELIKQIDKKMVADGLGNICIDEGVWEKFKQKIED